MNHQEQQRDFGERWLVASAAATATDGTVRYGSLHFYCHVAPPMKCGSSGLRAFCPVTTWCRCTSRAPSWRSRKGQEVLVDKVSGVAGTLVPCSTWGICRAPTCGSCICCWTCTDDRLLCPRCTTCLPVVASRSRNPHGTRSWSCHGRLQGDALNFRPFTLKWVSGLTFQLRVQFFDPVLHVFFAGRLVPD